VDEPVRSTQTSFTMAPPSPEVDPTKEATDAVVDNGIMSPSRMRSESSRSASDRRDGGATGEALAGGTPAAAEGGTKTGPAAAAPLPADTIGKAKPGAAVQPAETGKPAKPAEAAETAEPAASEAPAVKSGLTPSFTPSASAPDAWAASAAAAPAASQAPAKPAAAPTSHSGTGSSYTRAEYAPPSSYPPPRAAGTRASAAAPAQPAGGYSAGNGSPSGPASAMTGAVSGAAAGLANSVSSAWQRRGSNGQWSGTRGTQVRRPAKRQAMLTLARVEPWSVMKFSFIASVVAFIILFVAVAVLYMVLSALGVFDSLQHTISSITGAQGTTGTNISHYYSASLILGYTAMLGALNIVLITAMSTVGSVIYNLIAKTIGGIEVTLRETD
jgi:Transmembrane domain of unknown function (DUF3566)